MVNDWLETLGIDTITQWDVIVFLHRRRSTLLSAENIARLMRYKTAMIIGALDSLEILSIVERSRLSRGARLYQLARLEGPRGRAFAELLALSGSRTGRLQVSARLGNARSYETISVRGGGAGYPGARVAGGRARNREIIGKEGERWLKAI